MKKAISLFTLGLLILISGITILILQPRSLQRQTLTVISPIQSISPSNKPQEFTARFEIYTNGLLRSFRSPKYHNRSTDVFIVGDQPSVVQVTKPGITWQEFFDTLPMKLTPTCLTTGDGETYCTSQTHELTFSINKTEIPNALFQQIQENDFLTVKYARKIATNSAASATSSAQ